MALITRCPDCATAFRITPLQLQAHGGDVRCGHCARIFNGFATLATMQEPEAVDLSRKTVPDKPESSEIPSVSDSPLTALTDQEVSSKATGNETAQTEAASKSPPPEAPEPEASVVEEPALQVPHATSAPESNPAENYPPDDYTDDYAFNTAPSHKTSPAWGFASLFLLVVLAAQAIYFYRAELSIIAPAARPFLEQYCELLGCTIPPPQNSGLLNSGSSAMQAGTQRSDAITLNATVPHYAPYPHAFPSFELTPTDSSDQPLAGHTFDPVAYLEKMPIRLEPLQRIMSST